MVTENLFRHRPATSRVQDFGLRPAPQRKALAEGRQPSRERRAATRLLHGLREASNGFAIGCNCVEEGATMGTAIVPHPDSIQGPRMLTANFETQHGDGMEFLRNPQLAARGFFSPHGLELSPDRFASSPHGYSLRSILDAHAPRPVPVEIEVLF